MTSLCEQRLIRAAHVSHVRVMFLIPSASHTLPLQRELSQTTVYQLYFYAALVD